MWWHSMIAVHLEVMVVVWEYLSSQRRSGKPEEQTTVQVLEVTHRLPLHPLSHPAFPFPTTNSPVFNLTFSKTYCFIHTGVALGLLLSLTCSRFCILFTQTGMFFHPPGPCFCFLHSRDNVFSSHFKAFSILPVVFFFCFLWTPCTYILSQ